jgi:hypothetical protein
VRRQDVPRLPAQHGWVFQTKLQQAADLVLRAVETLQNAGKDVWVVTDGAYTKRPFVRPAMDLGVTLVGRLRKDAALCDLPPRDKPGAKKRRGRKRKYGKHRLSLAKRAAHPQGWRDVTCSVYGSEVVKRVKTFLATHRTFGGVIRVVIVKETHGCQHFFCTNPQADPREIIEAFADRAVIEQDFHDVKEVGGAGQQQVRNIWANIGAFNLNLWMQTLVELWGWKRRRKQLCNRSNSPWDDPTRRPSHADRRRALRRLILQTELSTITAVWRLPRKILNLNKHLMNLTL